MASLRRRYQTNVERRDDNAPVAAAPQPSAASPPPATEHPAPPAIEQERPEEVAAQRGIREHLADMENAERAVREPVQPPRAPEPPKDRVGEIIDQCQLGETAKAWLRNHPEFVTDQGRNQQIVYLHDIAKRKCGGGEYTPDYFRVMDDLLGFSPAGNGKHLPPSEPVTPPYNGASRSQPPSPSPRPPAPRPGYTQPPAAPPTRQGYSLQTGRQTEPLRATDLDREYARIAGVSVEDYMEGKRRMEAEKKAGLHQ